MKRRLYFLFPHADQASTVVHELEQTGIGRSDIHALCRDEQALGDLPAATAHQRNDDGKRLEQFAWNANLGIFFVALGGLLWSVGTGSLLWGVLCLAIMALTFFFGGWFTLHVPNVHLDEFRDALSHREILLMVDVPLHRVSEIEDRVHTRHPEAAVGGVGWTPGHLGI